MAEHKIQYRAECRPCKGSGLYTGMAEHDGSAVVCHGCRGKGFVDEEITYRDFEGRKIRHGIRRVFRANPGIGIGRGKTKTGETFGLEDFGGMKHQDWVDGKPFPAKSEMRRFTCPAWWFQSADYKKKPQWKTCHFGAFSDCELFGQKDKCWERYDKHGPERPVEENVEVLNGAQ